MQPGHVQLQEWIDRQGFVTHMDAAKFMGFHFSFISHLLKGRRRPGLRNAVKIEGVTGIPAEAWVPISMGKPANGARGTSKKRQVLQHVNG
jgi:plasmid maintenance system antidote protein VapI